MIIAFPSFSCAVWRKNIWSTLSPPWCGRGLENSRLGPAVQERGIWLAFPTSSLLSCELCFFCKTLPNALSTLQEMFPIVSQTHFFAGGTNWKKTRSLFKCRKHWASHLKMRSVVFDNSRYVRDIECTSQIEASKSPLPRATFGAFEFLENFCLNSRLPGPKSCSNAPSEVHYRWSNAPAPGRVTRLLF